MYEIIKYDEKKGYFALAKGIRLILALVRILFIPILLIKDIVS